MDPIYVRSSSSEEDEDMPEEQTDFMDMDDTSPTMPEIKRECAPEIEIVPKDDAT